MTTSQPTAHSIDVASQARETGTARADDPNDGPNEGTSEVDPRPDVATRDSQDVDNTSRLTAACLINHFDYERFIADAVDSAVSQTLALDEIVVVDDGSSPAGLRGVRDACQRHPQVRLLEKANGGQLSCFQAGLDATTADIVFFLDADDIWQAGYVEAVMRVFEERPDIDLVQCNERRVFSDGRSEVTESPSRDLGYSIARSLVNGDTWTGQPTSCVALRRTALDKIFPLPGFERWRTCADEALIYGSSVVGARKYFIGTPLVDYRVHGGNLFHGQEYCAKARLLRGVEVLRLVERLRRRHDLPESLAHVAHHEFRTIESPTKKEYISYRRLVKHSALPAQRRRRVAFAIWAWYRLQKRL